VTATLSFLLYADDIVLYADAVKRSSERARPNLLTRANLIPLVQQMPALLEVQHPRDLFPLQAPLLKDYSILLESHRIVLALTQRRESSPCQMEKCSMNVWRMALTAIRIMVRCRERRILMRSRVVKFRLLYKGLKMELQRMVDRQSR
jgi:hypothetical protein